MAKHFFFLSFITFLFAIANADQSPQSNITKGNIIYTNSAKNFWPSHSGHFAFGFYNSGANVFRVGIWLVGSPKNTILWTAARNDPGVPAGASLAFAEDGRVLVRGPAGEILLVIVEPTQMPSVASMLDSGKFVLYTSNSEIVWSSFDYPTNTLLVGQTLERGKSLYSSLSETNDSIGNFRLLMLGDGNLIAIPVRIFPDYGKFFYWNSQTSKKGNSSLSLASDGRLYLQNSTGGTVQNIFNGGYSVEDTVFYRATFDIDGVLRLYRHRIGAAGSFLSEPPLQMIISYEDGCIVKGACGLNSYCALNGSNPVCLCPPGFIPIDPKQTNQGCMLNFSVGSEDCFNKKTGENRYKISVLANTVWERNDYDVLSGISEEACSSACLNDCNCVVATIRDQICFKQKLPLRYGQKNLSISAKSFVKSTLYDYELPSAPYNVTKKPGKKFLIVGIALIALSSVVFVLSGYLVCINRAWSYKIVSRQAALPEVIEEINLKSFSYHQLVVATNDFKEEIGRGASGRVYKGNLVDGGGKEIAVKRLEKMVEESESVFRNEMKIIGKTHHKNLVHLIGFCSQGSKRLLVYEFMKNGSLGNLLFQNENRPRWAERMRIALEIAKGLHYLHEDCPTRIIHCDVKPHNILMDESWTAKISDFGLSKLLKPDQTRTYTTPRGTRGYGAPEWFRNDTPITVKADVYSFGILLLEIICCRKNLDIQAKEDEILLMNWVNDCHEARELGKLVRNEEVNLEELEKMVKIGLWCLQKEPALRPSMKSVVLMIEGNAVTPLPPPLYSINSVEGTS